MEVCLQKLCYHFYQILWKFSRKTQVAKSRMRINCHRGEWNENQIFNLQDSEGRMQPRFTCALTSMPPHSEFALDNLKLKLRAVCPHGIFRKPGLFGHCSSIPIAFCMTFSRWCFHTHFPSNSFASFTNLTKRSVWYINLPMDKVTGCDTLPPEQHMAQA